MTKDSNPDYLAKVALLSKEDTERLLSRMTGKLPRRLQKNKLSNEEALAIQLELEDEQLQEWRERMQFLRDKEAAKTKVTDKETEKNKITEKAAVQKEDKPLKVKNKNTEENDKAPVKAKSKSNAKSI